jgi:hypothetical protein
MFYFNLVKSEINLGILKYCDKVNCFFCNYKSSDEEEHSQQDQKLNKRLDILGEEKKSSDILLSALMCKTMKNSAIVRRLPLSR